MTTFHHHEDQTMNQMNHEHGQGSGSKGRLTIRVIVKAKQGIAQKIGQAFWSSSDIEVFTGTLVCQKNIAFFLHLGINFLSTNWSMNQLMSHVSHLLPLLHNNIMMQG